MSDLDLIDSGPERDMGPHEQQLAKEIYASIQRMTNESTRSLQSTAHRVGISDLGFCSERVRLHIAGEEEPVVDHLPAFIGTAIGDDVERSVVIDHPGWVAQAEVTIVLSGDTGTYTINGHPDLIDPEGELIDVKTVDGLGRVRRTGPSQQQQFQRHCYALAAHRQGLFRPEIQLEDVVVSNVWVDRSARDRELYVHSEPFNMLMVHSATEWLDDVVYAFRHGELARKEPPREMCFAACGFAPVCRAGHVDGQGLITDPGQLAAVSMMQEAAALKKKAAKLETEAKIALQGVNGSTGSFSVRWVEVGGGAVSYQRKPYLRLDIKPLHPNT
jgi:hypothetical protein